MMSMIGASKRALRFAPRARLATCTSNPRLMSSAAGAVQSEDGLQKPRLDQPPEELYWQKIPRWKNVSRDEFISYDWQARIEKLVRGIHHANLVQKSNGISRADKLVEFLHETLPRHNSHEPAYKVGPYGTSNRSSVNKDIRDIEKGIEVAKMQVRVTPHLLSLMDWSNFRNDPIFRQFLPLASAFRPDHPKLTLDSLHEQVDSVERGLVHRYPTKALFLANSICPTYCTYCTRSYAVGGHTETVDKKSLPLNPKRWKSIFDHIRNAPAIEDVVVSGGDTFYLSAENLRHIAAHLLAIPHIRRFRFATKGLAVCPSRFIDPEDEWIRAVVDIAKVARGQGVDFAIHTHFNHPNEVSWITRKAARALFQHGVTVRNQTVLLKGVNDNLNTMSTLIRTLANDLNVEPYYVYQCDMVKGVEDLRTPLSTILELEQNIRGTIAGFRTPQFVVDLPGGGGKRLAASYETYDRSTGESTFRAPGVKGEDAIFKYYDPVPIVQSG